MATLRLLKRVRFPGGQVHEAGSIHQIKDADHADALLRGPDPQAEELSPADLKAIEREEKREAETAAKRKKAEEE